MKALKSPLAKQLLADPQASADLRRYLARKSAGAAAEPVIIQIRNGQDQPVRVVQPIVVPKAA
ncbi:hypothetical protein J7U46_08255 [Pelomonas sp. V22]|uniref:hypothetical protein n=1 Tax=Pelomonas sp. V22 TaxID=2822139 RepID=UPI0024A7D0FE|nr:hypothetical protein [Pelomonas sp. V22]MDI4633040.1 hypothetical protein [Pelomonas sp. V22]